MSDRTGQVWEMGNGVLFLVLCPSETGRQVMQEAGHPDAGDRRLKQLDRFQWHTVLYLEHGSVGGLMEDRDGAWEKMSRAWRRHA